MTDLTSISELIKQVGLIGGFFVYLLYRFDKALSIEAKQDKIFERQTAIIEKLDDIHTRLEALDRVMEWCKLKWENK
jgi:hypothetical protein